MPNTKSTIVPHNGPPYLKGPAPHIPKPHPKVPYKHPRRKIDPQMHMNYRKELPKGVERPDGTMAMNKLRARAMIVGAFTV